MAKQSPTQKKIVARVMGEFKDGDLEKRDGTPVENPKQAIAIALHEAGASQFEDAATNRRNLRRTRQREIGGGVPRAANERSKAGLYAEARRRGVKGRSGMTKRQLAGALAR